MSIIKTNTAHRGGFDHFEPEQNLDAADQRRLRGHLEQIDYTAFAANQAVLKQVPGVATLEAIKRLAVAAAQARGRWVNTALDFADSGRPLTGTEAKTLADMRLAYDELTAAYEGLRRMVERGYVTYRPTE